MSRRRRARREAVVLECEPRDRVAGFEEEDRGFCCALIIVIVIIILLLLLLFETEFFDGDLGA